MRTIVDSGVPWPFWLVLAVHAPLTIWVMARMPDEVRTDDDGLTLVAPRRTVHVPWHELTDIRRWNNHPLWLEWRWTRGSIVTHAQFSDWSELLSTAQRRATNLRSTP